MPIYAVRTTAGQERNVAKLIALNAKAYNIPIKAIAAPETMKGYVFVEADGPHIVDKAIMGVRHVRSRVPGVVDIRDLERFLISKPVIEELDIGDEVEVVAGPLRGARARVMRIDKERQEVVVELLEVTFAMPVTVGADSVRLVRKAKSAEKP